MTASTVLTQLSDTDVAWRDQNDGRRGHRRSDTAPGQVCRLARTEPNTSTTPAHLLADVA
ncbi:hypothetical protein HC251_14280 [Iamia sp. SCSIO 61187]|uniref:hypothetical protein n=1 Tax=Iamia sp. SCSIO 61187 TaxID=2722752 RepID=UPI001C629D31|nr:hypothetical protein [Iamia sp. SCSIO 61187]QYG93476.1 hypothetical protein HC251_14280 [Iamia sp. SCSIO 61187]